MRADTTHRHTTELTQRIVAAWPLIAAAEIADEPAGRVARLRLDPRLLSARAEAQGLADASAEAAAANPRVQRLLIELFVALNEKLPPEARLTRVVVVTGPGSAPGPDGPVEWPGAHGADKADAPG